MRAGGINWLAVLAATVAAYAIGFLIYGILIEQMAGVSAEEMAATEGRMPFGFLLPLALAVFLALLLKWGGVKDAARGAQWGLVVALASAVPTVWYSWVYGDYAPGMALIDSGHLMLTHVAAGAILGAWR